jgi:hypothetical protein
MNQKRTLHILNGQEMYQYFKETRFLEGESMVPFNEAMCFGNTCDNLFSEEFIELRSNVHHVTTAKYKEITLNPLQPLFTEKFDHITLWFDTDMFCQINLLTILAWLDRAEYKDSIELKIVGEIFKPVSYYALKAEGYYAIYQQVLLDKTRPEYIHPKPLKKGIELYLTYLHKDSELIRYIQKQHEIPENELVSALIAEFQHYGLGDTQYMEIIKSHR